MPGKLLPVAAGRALVPVCEALLQHKCNTGSNTLSPELYLELSGCNSGQGLYSLK